MLKELFASIGIFLAGIFGSANLAPVVAPSLDQPASAIVALNGAEDHPLALATSSATTTVINQYLTQPVIEREIVAQNAVTREELNASLAALRADLVSTISASLPKVYTFSGPARTTPVSTATFAHSQRIDSLGNVTITNATVNGVSGLTASDMPDLSGEYLSLSGGTVAFSDHRFGIGTTSPAYTLDVAGFINTDQYSGYKQAGNTVLYASTTNYSILVGQGAGAALLSDGFYNTALGYQALNVATSSDYNTAVGFQALFSNTTGINNTANGFRALFANTTGNSNTANGYQALFSNTTGVNNTVIGRQALFSNTTGSSNTANGIQALNNNTTGSSNTANGLYALFSNTTGSSNTANGVNSLYYNNSATSSTALGYQAARGTSAYNNQGGVYLGFNSGYSAATGSDYNTLIGYSAGNLLTTGAGNILIGAASTTANSNLTTGYSNISIGNNIKLPVAAGSYQLNIGNLLYGTGLDGTGTVLSSGNIGIGSTTPWRKFAVTGTVGIDGLTGSTGAGSLCLSASREVVYNAGTDACLPSLRETKHDISVLSLDALQIVDALDPVSFIYNEGDGRVRYGFIAEDTAVVDPHLVTYSASGTLSGIDDRALLSIVVKALQNLINRVGEFADRFTTKELIVQKLCIGLTCVTEDQLKALLNQSGQQAASPTQTSDPTPSNNEAATTTDSDVLPIAADNSTSSPQQSTQDATTSSNDEAATTTVSDVPPIAPDASASSPQLPLQDTTSSGNDEEATATVSDAPPLILDASATPTDQTN